MKFITRIYINPANLELKWDWYINAPSVAVLKEVGWTQKGKVRGIISHPKAPNYLLSITGLTTIAMLRSLKIKVIFNFFLSDL